MNIATIKFQSPINKENSFNSWSLGEHTSTMTLYVNDQDWKKGSIEWDIPTADEYVEIGLWFEDDETTLRDYDGLFALPEQAIKLLRDNGYTVDKSFE